MKELFYSRRINIIIICSCSSSVHTSTNVMPPLKVNTNSFWQHESKDGYRYEDKPKLWCPFKTICANRMELTRRERTLRGVVRGSRRRGQEVFIQLITITPMWRKPQPKRATIHRLKRGYRSIIYALAYRLDKILRKNNTYDWGTGLPHCWHTKCELKTSPLSQKNTG